METYFAPARKADPETIRSQIRSISRNPVMTSVLNTVSGLLVIVNQNRQVIAMNSDFLNAAGIPDAEAALGMRLGETLSCIHAHDHPHGCGTTEHCVTCGAAIAMVTAIDNDQTCEKICTLAADKDGVIIDLSFLIRAQPVTISGTKYILVFATDITRQQFWANLERVFFHDISNILVSLHGNATLLADQMPDSPELKLVLKATDRLWNEVLFQKTLFQHKDAPYRLKKTTVDLTDIREDLESVIQGHREAENRIIRYDWPGNRYVIETDPLLLSRILINMMINALEASRDGGAILVSAKVTPGRVTWEVWSESYIPEKIQKRIFQRHFSTKADLGRGLGTYSMKLFGENYLNGKVWFDSSPGGGTTFSLSLPC